MIRAQYQLNRVKLHNVIKNIPLNARFVSLQKLSFGQPTLPDLKDINVKNVPKLSPLANLKNNLFLIILSTSGFLVG